MYNSPLEQLEIFPFFAHLGEKTAGILFFIFFSISFLCGVLEQLKYHISKESGKNDSNLNPHSYRYKMLLLFMIFCIVGDYFNVCALSTIPLLYIVFDVFVHTNFYFKYKDKKFVDSDLQSYKKTISLVQALLFIFFYTVSVLVYWGVTLLFY